MSTMAYQITGVSTLSSTVCSDAYQTKHQSSASTAFVRSDRWIPRTKGPATRKMYPFDDGIMGWNYLSILKLQRLHRWSLGMDKLFHPALYWACNYLSVIGLKLIHIIKETLGVLVYSISQEICTRFLLCCALLWLYIDWFSHIHQAYFTGTVAIWRLPQCQQSNPDAYG